MDLVEILKRPEGKTLEFKRDLSSPEEVEDLLDRLCVRLGFCLPPADIVRFGEDPPSSNSAREGFTTGS